MKKLLLCLIPLLLFCGCSTKTLSEEEKIDISATIENPMKVSIIKSAMESDSKLTRAQIIFNRMPENFIDIHSIDRSGEDGKYITAAMLVGSLSLWNPSNPDNCNIALKSLLNSPTVEKGYTNNTESFVKERMMQNEKYPYLAKAYFDGANKENNYSIGEPISLTVEEFSKDSEESTIYGTKLNIEKLNFKVNDSIRTVSFYQDPVDGVWYVWSDSYSSLLADIQ